MLRQIKPEYSQLLSWASLFSGRLLYQKSLASLLWRIQQSQNPHCRQLWYLTCFAFASVPAISERVFANEFTHHWKLSVFFYIQDQSSFFRIFESYKAGVNYQQFTANYFRTHKPSTLLLRYEHFHLRAPAFFYLHVWFHAEHIRLRLYNDYVRFDPYASQRLIPKYRWLQRIFARRNRLRRLYSYRWRFFYRCFQQKHHAFEFRGLSLPYSQPLMDTEVVPFRFLSILDHWRTKVTLAARQLPLAGVRQTYYLRWAMEIMNIWGHSLLADEPFAYWRITRYDWHYFWQTIGILMITDHFRVYTTQIRELRRQDLLRWTKQEQREYFFDFPLLEALQQSKKSLKTSRQMYFVWWTLFCKVNRTWNFRLLNKFCDLLTHHGNKRGINMQIFLLCQQRLAESIVPWDALWANMVEMSTFFHRKLSPLDFLFWRIYNGSDFHDYLRCGEFSLEVYYRRLILDYYATQRSLSLSCLLEHFFGTHGFYLHRGYTCHGSRSNPWVLEGPRRLPRQLPNGVFDPNEPQIAYIPYVYSQATFRLVLGTCRRSRLLSALSFFLFLEGFSHAGNRLSNFFQEILWVILSYRRYLRLYRTSSLRRFRRYPERVYVVSRRDPGCRERWFSFADRMRRAGIKKTDLPYYPDTDDVDLMNALKKRSTTSHWLKPAVYWIIN